MITAIVSTGWCSVQVTLLVFVFVLFLVLLTGPAFAHLNDYLRHTLFMLSGKKK